jgi:hypothetical protein
MAPKLPFAYNAFISYYQDVDNRLAHVLQKSLRTLGSKWYLLKFKALEIFRDETDSLGCESLKEKILKGINQSEFLILLASNKGKEIRKELALRDWVSEEVEYLLNIKTTNLDTEGKSKNPNIILCVTDGDIKWDYIKNDFDWNVTNCLPENLKNTFIDTPQWVDLRKIKEKQTENNLELSLEFSRV